MPVEGHGFSRAARDGCPQLCHPSARVGSAVLPVLTQYLKPPLRKKALTIPQCSKRHECQWKGTASAVPQETDTLSFVIPAHAWDLRSCQFSRSILSLRCEKKRSPNRNAQSAMNASGRGTASAVPQETDALSFVIPAHAWGSAVLPVLTQYLKPPLRKKRSPYRNAQITMNVSGRARLQPCRKSRRE